MAGVKVWSGSAFVDGQPRIWNGSAFVAPASCHVWDGTGFVKVWPSFMQQRMVKVGDASFGFGASQDPVTGWATDATHQATVAGHKLVVQGGGAATVSARLLMRAATGDTFSIQLRRNGVVIASGSWRDDGSTQTRTLTAAETVAPGDLIHLSGTQGFASTSYIYAGSWIDVTPTP